MRGLLTCVSRGCIDEAEKILLAGANVEVKGKEEMTPMLRACQNGDVNMMKLLNSYNADIRAVGREKKGAFDYALESKNTKAIGYVISLLSKKPKNCMSKNQKRKDATPRLSPFIQAARKGDLLRMEDFLQKGAEVDAPDYRNRSALVHAVNTGQAQSVRFLLEHGADVGYYDCEGTTLLHLALACKKPDTELIKVLVEYGCDVNAPYHIESNTPLHLAVRYHADAEAIKLLIDFGADIMKKDSFDLTPYEWFCWEIKQDIEVGGVFIDAISNMCEQSQNRLKSIKVTENT